MIVKYEIKRHKQMNCYIVWKNSKTENGLGCKGVFFGTRQQCLNFIEELKKES